MQSGKQIIIEFIPNFRDYVPAIRISQLPIFRMIDIVFPVFSLGVGLWYWMSYNELNWWVIFLFAMAVISWFNGFRLLQFWIALNFNPIFREKFQFTIADSGIIYKTSKSEQSMGWDFYRKFYNMDHVICLVYGKCSCSVIPKRAFTSQDDIDHFLNLLENKIGTK